MVLKGEMESYVFLEQSRPSRIVRGINVIGHGDSFSGISLASPHWIRRQTLTNLLIQFHTVDRQSRIDIDRLLPYGTRRATRLIQFRSAI